MWVGFLIILAVFFYTRTFCFSFLPHHYIIIDLILSTALTFSLAHSFTLNFGSELTNVNKKIFLQFNRFHNGSVWIFFFHILWQLLTRISKGLKAWKIDWMELLIVVSLWVHETEITTALKEQKDWLYQKKKKRNSKHLQNWSTVLAQFWMLLWVEKISSCVCVCVFLCVFVSVCFLCVFLFILILIYLILILFKCLLKMARFA